MFIPFRDGCQDLPGLAPGVRASRKARMPKPSSSRQVCVCGFDTILVVMTVGGITGPRYVERR